VRSNGKCKVKQAARVPGEQDFDPGTIAITAYEVMIVLTKIGAAVQLVDWVLKKISSFKSRNDAITITAGSKTITIAGAGDVDELRRVLADRDPVTPPILQAIPMPSFTFGMGSRLGAETQSHRGKLVTTRFDGLWRYTN
jgi:hypothetical protein